MTIYVLDPGCFGFRLPSFKLVSKAHQHPSTKNCLLYIPNKPGDIDVAKYTKLTINSINRSSPGYIYKSNHYPFDENNLGLAYGFPK